MKTDQLRLFSVAYKPVDYGFPGGWVEPFAVGPLADQATPGLLCDRGGCSIAERNFSYGELTAQYWVWKNITPVEYIGFCHYRRYFNFMAHPQIALPKVHAAPSAEALALVSNHQQCDLACRVLSVCDVITTRQYTLDQTIAQQFIEHHGGDIWSVFVQAIRDTCPEWLVSCIPWLDLSFEFRFYPIFITRWPVFDEFCSLLFPVLFEVERHIGILPDIPGQRFQPGRYPAYLSERFWMLYLHARKLRVYGAQLLALEADA